MDGSVNVSTRVCGALVHASIYKNGTIKFNSLTSIRDGQETRAVKKILAGVRQAALLAASLGAAAVVPMPANLSVGKVVRGAVKVGSSCMFLIRPGEVRKLLRKQTTFG